ncbi:energy transducer TonB [Larsenimonas rhizosphaerae]|uniref:energy transducer TonB n=1 Tax=Larsenimonas rhizosphaerae TaxID=2944682 RepID=UPI00203471A9|nr:energy transducer TonB [Larsenimonas rhizosphaerae]MCM2130944.1 energy transducer TonB [Larsenimonas rhizosphaerae]
MMAGRRLGALIGGAVLALCLFYLLALLVAPPESLSEPPPRLSVSMVEAPQDQKARGDAQSSRAQQRPAPPPAAPPRPEARPAPAPDVQSSVSVPPTPTPPVSPKVSPSRTAAPSLSVAKAPPTPSPSPAPAQDPSPSSAPAAAAGGQKSDSTAMQSGAAEPTRKVLPDYPRRARLRGTEGYVELQYVILRSGRVDRASIKVLESRPGSTFDDAALEAVAQWQYPRRPQPMRTRQRIEFKLRG